MNSIASKLTSLGIMLALAVGMIAPAAAFANVDASAADDSATATASALAASDKDDESSTKDKSEDPSKTERTGNAFTFSGTGTTVDTASSADGVDFYTIKSEDNSVYYLVVDHNSSSDNVYLLSEVSDADLKALSKSGTINLGGAIAADDASEKASANATQKDEPQPEEQKIPDWLLYLGVVAIVGSGAFAYYKLKVKPEREEAKVSEEDIRSFEQDLGLNPDFDVYNRPYNG